jgi:hypothetical protein
MLSKKRNNKSPKRLNDLKTIEDNEFKKKNNEKKEESDKKKKRKIRNWVRSGNDTSDFLTLIRNLVFYFYIF